MKGTVLFVTLLVGIALGVAGTVYAPHYVKSFLPGPSKPRAGGVEGRVTAELPEADRLLLTVSTPEGATLVTFNRKMKEIDLLVDEGDSVTLDLKYYSPFVTNPAILRVRKAEAPVLSPGLIPEEEAPGALEGPIEEMAEPPAGEEPLEGPAPGEQGAEEVPGTGDAGTGESPEPPAVDQPEEAGKPI
jgi:hypothetical protein